ncbi:BON domain-containing protein [Mucilaginibacter litoreus]|uniref:BON domain-containing protein n=1 Tax=Mucilaginibacter litoreus TaxID=1048221 RepID=A0ABW3AY49_9SPHI
MKQNNLTRSLAVLTIGLGMGVITSCGGPDDQNIQTNVKKELQSEAGLKDVKATVKDGVVKLEGNCNGENCDSLATRKTKAVAGVKSVENTITKSVETDLTLRTAVQSVVSKYQGVQADVAGGVVVLRGSIAKNQVQPLINELQALKPKKLDNQLAVQ